MKKYVAWFTAIFTLLVMPLISFTWSFIITTTSTNAEMPELKRRVDNIEKSYSRIEGKMDALLEGQRELKNAYTKRGNK